MFGLKPDEQYNKYFSEAKRIFTSKNTRIDIRENYGSCHSLQFLIWKRTKDYEQNYFILKHSFNIYFTLYGYYIRFIYPHLGICHPNLRSKFYIGKPIEKTWKQNNREEI